jgi:hypothetical protein
MGADNSLRDRNTVKRLALQLDRIQHRNHSDRDRARANFLRIPNRKKRARITTCIACTAQRFCTCRGQNGEPKKIQNSRDTRNTKTTELQQANKHLFDVIRSS